MISLIYLPLYLFFSSRRRHTRWPRDWSSDVCSSDLVLQLGDLLVHLVVRVLQGGLVAHLLQEGLQVGAVVVPPLQGPGGHRDTDQAAGGRLGVLAVGVVSRGSVALGAAGVGVLGLLGALGGARSGAQ